MTGRVLEADREVPEQPGQPQEKNRQLNYIARYIWAVQRENEALRQRIALLEAF